MQCSLFNRIASTQTFKRSHLWFFFPKGNMENKWNKTYILPEAQLWNPWMKNGKISETIQEQVNQLSDMQDKGSHRADKPVQITPNLPSYRVVYLRSIYNIQQKQKLLEERNLCSPESWFRTWAENREIKKASTDSSARWPTPTALMRGISESMWYPLYTPPRTAVEMEINQPGCMGRSHRVGGESHTQSSEVLLYTPAQPEMPRGELTKLGQTGRSPFHTLQYNALVHVLEVLYLTSSFSLYKV